MSDTITTIPLADFITAHGLRMSVAWTDRNPLMDPDSDRQMDYWRCTIRHGRSSMRLTFSMGSGHHGAEPTLADVLNCLAFDAASVENAPDFPEWCYDIGYDTDSRKAERTYKACERQASSLRRLLGHQAYETLLWHTERL